MTARPTATTQQRHDARIEEITSPHRRRRPEAAEERADECTGHDDATDQTAFPLRQCALPGAAPTTPARATSRPRAPPAGSRQPRRPTSTAHAASPGLRNRGNPVLKRPGKSLSSCISPKNKPRQTRAPHHGPIATQTARRPRRRRQPRAMRQDRQARSRSRRPGIRIPAAGPA